MSAIIPVIVRLAGLAGVRLSPFWAGAAIAGVIALLIGGALTAAGVHLYNSGYAAADGAWREKALEAQLAAMRADLDAARKAAGDEALRAATIQNQTEQERAGTNAYVEELEKQNAALAAGGKPNVCALTCDDLRGLRIKSSACAAPPGAAASAGAAPRSGFRSFRKTE